MELSACSEIERKPGFVTSSGSRVSGNMPLVAELREMLLSPGPQSAPPFFPPLTRPPLFIYRFWHIERKDQVGGQYSVQSDCCELCVCCEVFLNAVFAQSWIIRREVLSEMYQEPVSSEVKYPWPWSFIFVCRDFINAHVKIKPNKQIFHRCHQEFIWNMCLGWHGRNC